MPTPAPELQAPPRSISVLMPTFQGSEFLERALASLAEQRVPLPWDFLAIDSGSTDGTLAILERWRGRFPVPFGLRRIHAVEFDHGDTRNLLAAESDGDLLVFLTQDAVPLGPGWLARLARNFEDPRVGAAYCRNEVRPQADPLTRVFALADPGYAAERREVRLPAGYESLDPHARRLLYNFNDVASAVRRPLWKRHPFPRAWFGEDLLMARALLEGGYTVVYDAEAAVEHSHDYGPAEMRARAEVDGRFNAEYLDRVCVGSAADAGTQVERQLRLDRAALEAAGFASDALEVELARACELRRAAFEGLFEGGRSPRRRPRSALSKGGPLHLLYVVHGFPPETWAGTEVYTLELAREMQRRGHRVTILARTGAPADPDAPELSIEEGEFDGLPVLRLVHRLHHERLEQAWSHPGVERAFARLLARLCPDLVHFQHLIHLSAGLVQVARAAGLPTVVHCHDYWPICARVQLIRPDGARCDHNMAGGCLACVSGRGLEHVERLAAIDPDERGGEALREELGAAGIADPGLAPLLDRQGAVLAAWAAADLRISPSRFLRAKLLETGAFDPHAFLYSDNGMRTEGVRRGRAGEPRGPGPLGPLGPMGTARTPLRFGFVGSLVWYKGVELLVGAMRLLESAGRDAVLSVHGAFDPEHDELHRRLQELAGDNVTFHGRFDNRRLAEVYAGIDVLVVPSLWYENSPITIHEAHLLETPVVTADIGGMAEYVRDGVDGLHFRAGDVADLARVLERFTREPGLVEALSRDFPRIKTIEENARELEFRYRGLCCLERPSGRVRLLERAGADDDGRRGAAELQGADLLLLRAGASADYDLTDCGAGPRRVALELLALGAEPDLRQAGEVLLDGRAVGRFGPFSAAGPDRTGRFEFDLELPAGARLTVRVEGSTCVRVARVVVEGEAAAVHAAGPRAQAGARA